MQPLPLAFPSSLFFLLSHPPLIHQQWNWFVILACILLCFTNKSKHPLNKMGPRCKQGISALFYCSLPAPCSPHPLILWYCCINMILKHISLFRTSKYITILHNLLLSWERYIFLLLYFTYDSSILYFSSNVSDICFIHLSFIWRFNTFRVQVFFLLPNHCNQYRVLGGVGGVSQWFSF